jgi:hypothetical protein
MPKPADTSLKMVVIKDALSSETGIFSPGDAQGAFDPASCSSAQPLYTVKVKAGVNSVTVAAMTNSSAANLTLREIVPGGKVVALKPGQQSPALPLNGGDGSITAISLEVHAGSSASKTYQFSVTKEADTSPKKAGADQVPPQLDQIDLCNFPDGLPVCLRVRVRFN